MIDQGDGARKDEESVGDDAQVQARIAALRRQVLGGRGPGASSEELSVHMHERVMLGAVPAILERELVAQQTALARGRDTTAIQRVIDRERDAVVVTVSQIVDRLAPGRAVTRAIQEGRRRMAALLDMPTGGNGDAVASRPSTVSDRHQADLWRWRIFVIGAANGAALVVAVHTVLSRWKR